MTQKSRKSFEATVRRGEVLSVKFYKSAVATALAGAEPDSDFLDMYPFTEDTNLAYAIFRLAVDKIRGGARERREVEDVRA